MLRALTPLLGLLAVGYTCGLSAPAQAGIINTFDAPGDVVTSPTQAAGTWYNDLKAQAGATEAFAYLYREHSGKLELKMLKLPNPNPTPK